MNRQFWADFGEIFIGMLRFMVDFSFRSFIFFLLMLLMLLLFFCLFFCLLLLTKLPPYMLCIFKIRWWCVGNLLNGSVLASQKCAHKNTQRKRNTTISMYIIYGCHRVNFAPWDFLSVHFFPLLTLLVVCCLFDSFLVTYHDIIFKNMIDDISRKRSKKQPLYIFPPRWYIYIYRRPTTLIVRGNKGGCWGGHDDTTTCLFACDGACRCSLLSADNL